MKNFALRFVLILLYVVCTPLSAIWLVFLAIPVFLVMVGYWLVTGKWESWIFGLSVLPMIAPLGLQDYMKNKNII